MKQKLMNLLSILKSGAAKIYSVSPLLCGLVIGFCFKPEIQALLQLLLSLVKDLFKLL